MLAVYLGDRLGLYRALADETSLTSTQLAAATDTHERYVREWLEQQAASAILAVDDASAPASDRRYSLPSGHDEALLDESSLNLIAPIAQLVFALACVLSAAGPADARPATIKYEVSRAGATEGELPPVRLHGRCRAQRPARVVAVGGGPVHPRLTRRAVHRAARLLGWSAPTGVAARTTAAASAST